MNKLLLVFALFLGIHPGLTAAESDVAKRQCRSVHITHGPMPQQCQAIYIEATAEKSSPGTYFSACNFNDGYIGFQELANGGKVVIFSIWDPIANGDNPNSVPDEDRVELMAAGDGIDASRFGGEGTGGKSMGKLDWQLGEKLKFLVLLTPSNREGYKVISGYVFHDGRWKLISSWRTHRSPRELSRSTSFVEDFRRNYESAKHVRSAVFGPCYVMDKNGHWHLMNTGTFTADSNPAVNIMAESVPSRHAFRIATGGDTVTGDFKLGDTQTLPSSATTKMQSPGQDVEDLIKNPVTEKP